MNSPVSLTSARRALKAGETNAFARLSVDPGPQRSENVTNQVAGGCGRDDKNCSSAGVERADDVDRLDEVHPKYEIENPLSEAERYEHGPQQVPAADDRSEH